jgi:hypothetical protein
MCHSSRPDRRRGAAKKLEYRAIAEKYPQAYFSGMVALSKVIKWDAGGAEMFDKTLSPEEIMDKLDQRVGPKGRKLFEQFLRKVNKLRAQQHLEAQAQTCVTERSGKRGRFSRQPRWAARQRPVR